MDKRIPLHAKDITGDLQTLSGYIVTLRAYPFTTDAITGTEAEDQPGYYDFTGIETNVAYQLWAGTTLSTLSRNTTFSGDDGTVIIGFDGSTVLDPADYDDYDIPVKVTVSTVEQFVPKSLTEIIEAGTLSMNDYYFVRGKLHQDNTLYSGRPFFGSVSINEETGALVANSDIYYYNSENNLVNTASDYVYRTGGAKVSTGKYYLQCQTGATTGTAVNGLRTEVAGSSFRYKFENSVFPVYGSRTVTPVSVGSSPISHIQRFDANHIRIKLSGYTLERYADFDLFIGSNMFLRDLVCDLSPLPNGAYELSSTDTTTGYLDFLCTTTSGTGTFVVATGTVSESESYNETYVPGLVGYVALDVNDDPLTYYDTGKILIKTYNTSWVLTDDILTIGCTLTFKALKISY